MSPRALAHDAGETLLEIAIAVMILSIGSVAVLGAVGTSITTTKLHREQSVAGRVLDNFAEYLKDPALSPYVPCASTSPTTATAYNGYRDAFLAASGNTSSKVYEPTIGQYTVTVTVEAGNPAPAADPSTVFVTCAAGASPYNTAAGDDRVQRLTLSVMRTGGTSGATVQSTKWRST